METDKNSGENNSRFFQQASASTVVSDTETAITADALNQSDRISTNNLNSALWKLFFGFLLSVLNMGFGNQTVFLLQSTIGAMLLIAAIWQLWPCGKYFRWSLGLYCCGLFFSSIAWFFRGAPILVDLDVSYSVGILSSAVITIIWLLLSFGFTGLYRELHPEGKLPLRWVWLCYGVTASLAALYGGDSEAGGLTAWIGLALFVVVLILINGTRLKLTRAGCTSESQPFSWEKWGCLVLAGLILAAVPFASAAVYQTREAPAVPYEKADVSTQAEDLEDDRSIRDHLIDLGAEPHLVNDLTQSTVKNLEHTIKVNSRFQVVKIRNKTSLLNSEKEEIDWLAWNTVLFERQDQPGLYCILYLSFMDIEKLKAAGISVDDPDTWTRLAPAPDTVSCYFNAPVMPKTCYRDELQLSIGDYSFWPEDTQCYTLYEKENVTYRSELEPGLPQKQNNSVFGYMLAQNTPVYEGVIKWCGTGQSQRVILCGEILGSFPAEKALQLSINYTHWNIPIDSPYHNLIPELQYGKIMDKNYNWVLFQEFDKQVEENQEAQDGL